MKLSFATLLPLLVTTVTAEGPFHPTKISYKDLLKGDGTMESSFVGALTTTGMVTITDIPSMNHKEEALAGLFDCIKESRATQEFTFPDGTRRRTLATHSVPGGIQTIDHKTSSEACKSFNQAAGNFRSTVATVTQAFADRLTEFFKVETTPILSSKTFAFETIADVVENGEHLEHFHAYEKFVPSEEETIELHTDQGLFIVFAPGLMIDCQDSTKDRLTSGFYIEEQDGTISEVQFDEIDGLVIMLGDGVMQYINEKLKGSKTLRAVPHTLLMASHDDSQARVWYGRMVLPPFDALHPSHDVTFGELRERMIENSHKKEEDTNPGLGCSGSKVARDLAETTCEGDTIYCWHRCMDPSEQSVSTEICASRNLELSCINPRLQIWGGENHGDFYPDCADPETQEMETQLPSLPNYPRDEMACTDDLFMIFSNKTGYANSHDLEGNATLMWTVEDGVVNGRLAYDGLFGWIAFGFANVGGNKNGMHGGTIIQALPGGNYSPYAGLDLTLEPTIDEYVIDLNESSFRYWMTPVTATEGVGEDHSYSVDTDGCNTALNFKASSIATKSFNLEGTDELIWAANGMDYYVGYHGMSRGRFAINWVTGELTPSEPTSSTNEPATSLTNEPASGTSSTSIARSSGILVFPMSIVLVLMVSF